MDNFVECCHSIPQLGKFMENGINIDPKPLSMKEFSTAGAVINGEPSPPFKALHVRYVVGSNRCCCRYLRGVFNERNGLNYAHLHTTISCFDIHEQGEIPNSC